MNRTGVAAAILSIACAWSAAQVPTSVQPEPPKTESAKPERPDGGWWDDVFTERTVTLTKVLASPDAYRDLPINFTVQFHQIAKTGPSFFTRFEPDSWLGFSAWSEDAPLWEKKAYENDFPHLFVRRDGADFRTVNGAAIYDRFSVSGVVRDVIKGKPWIEVTSVRRLPEKMSEGSLVHLVKGLTLRDHRRFDAAAREFQAADADTLPLQVRLLGMREEAFALLNAKKPLAAEERLVAALALDPQSSETAAALAHVREAMKSMPERLTTSRPASPGAPPAPVHEEPVTPGPPDPLAPKRKRSMSLPIPKASPTDTRPLNAGRAQPKPQQSRQQPGN
jgi:hypothetical protein